MADNPIKAKRIAQKDVYSSKSVVLTNTNDKNLKFGDIDQYPALEVILVGNQFFDVTDFKNEYMYVFLIHDWLKIEKVVQMKIFGNSISSTAHSIF